MGKVIFALIVVVLIAAGVFYLGHKGLGFGGGNGDNNGKGNNALTEQIVTTETIAQTEPTTDEIQYLELSVDGNDYIYKSQKYSIDEIETLITDIKNDDDLSIKLIDKFASRKAYTEIKIKLKENKIKFIEE